MFHVVKTSIVVSPAPKCSPIEPVYRKKYDQYGNAYYEELDRPMKVNEYIESFKNGCSLTSLLQRCELMPVHDKVSYLQQRESGVSADITNMPTDGTSAFIMLQKFKNDFPDIYQRVNKGESLDSILASFVKKPSETLSSEESKKTVEKEGTENG